MEGWFQGHLLHYQIQPVQLMTANGHHSADPSGLQTLELLAKADRFNKWMYDTIRPFCKGRVFEVGSGIRGC